MWNACIAALVLFQVTEPQPRIERLDNSLRVIIVEDHTLPLLSVQLWYAVGSAYDDPKNPGLCHVARTILANRDDAALRLRAAGVRFESRTLPDACYFASTCPPNFLEYVLTLEAARMQPLKTTPEMVATGLAAAARDYGLDPDDPTKLHERRLLAAMFPDHPYRNPAGFVADSLKSLAPDDVNELLERWFVPGNATLLIIGDVSDVAALELARQHFGKLPWAEPPRRPSWTAPAAEPIELQPIAAEHPGLDIAWLTPGASFGESAAAAVLMQRLCNPIDGPLAKRLADLGCPPPQWRHDEWREQGMLVLSVDTDPAPSQDISLLDEPEDEPTSRSATASSAPTSQPVDNSTIRRIVREELQRAVQSTPTEVELNRARALAAREIRQRRASFRQRSLDLGFSEIVAGDVLLADFVLARTERLGIADVQQAAADLLAARTVTSPRVAQSVTTTQPTAAQRAPSPTPLPAKPPIALDAGAALELLADHLAGAPPLQSPQPPATISADRLSNGVTLTTYTIPGLETAQVMTLIGDRYADMKAIYALMAVGSTRHSVTEMRDYLSYHGLDLFPLSVIPGAGLRSSGPPDRVAQMIELQAELLRFPETSDTAAEAAIGRTRDFFRRARAFGWSGDSPTYLPSGLIGWLPGTHLSHDPNEIRSSLHHLVQLAEIRILVVGPATAPDVRAVVADAWKDWHAPAREGRLTRDTPGLASTEPQPASGIRTSATWDTDPQRTRSTLMIHASLWPPTLDQPLRDLAEHGLVWSLGRPWQFSPELDSQHEWMWTAAWIAGGGPNAFADPPSRDIVSTIRAYLDRLDRARLGDMPRLQAAMALRLTRAERLTSLDSANAIADAVAADVSNPWDLQDNLSPVQFAELYPQVLRIRHQAVLGSGPEDHSADLARFEYHPPPAASAPSSP